MSVPVIRVALSSYAPLVGESAQAFATVYDEEGAIANDAVIVWSSSDENVATITNDGEIAAVAIGRAQIIATCGDFTSQASLTVIEDVGQFDAVEPRTFAVIQGGRVTRYTEALSADQIKQMPMVEDAIDVTEYEDRPPLLSWYENGEFSAPTPPPNTPSPTLVAAKLQRKAEINASCDAFRGQFVTNITAQMEIYSWKSDEVDAADAMIANGENPFLAEHQSLFPCLVEEAQAKGFSLQDVYTSVKNARTSWTMLGRMTEKRRQGLMGIIDRAQFIEQLPSANVNWGIPWPG